MEPRLSPITDPPRAQQRPALLDALRRSWMLIAVLVVVFASIATAVGLARDPTYQAETTLVVGKVDVQTPGLSGFVATTQSLASAYSRAIQTRAVLGPASRRIGSNPDEVSKRISASPVPDSPVFRVKADASSPEEATQLANGTSRALVRYIGDINRSSPRGGVVVKRLKAALVDVNRLVSRRNQLGRIARQDPSNGAREALVQAEAQLQTTKLRVRTLSTAYRASQSEASTNLVQVLAPARGASSDRGRMLQIFILIGILAGLALGVAIARLRANRAASQATRVALGPERT